MGMKISSKMIAAIDIGTTKICVLVALQDSLGKIELIGIGHHPSDGLKKGVVVNVAKTVESIKKALVKAEAMAGVKIDTACVGISGGHIKSLNSTGVVAVKSHDITQDDVDRVIDAARAVPIGPDQEILHVLPQYFKVDGQENILDSVGMHGVRLEAQVHIITGAVTSAQNIVRSCQLAGVQVSDIVLEQIASADAVLTPSERELGVGILDIGGGTSDFAIYKDGRILHSKVIPVAGNHFTNDLAIAFGIPLNKAELIKKSHGFVWEDKYFDLNKDTLEVDLGYQDGRRIIDSYSLFEVLNPRAQEVIDLLSDEFIKYKLMSFMPSGIVLTGGGSLLAGMPELTQKTLNLNVRVGLPGCFEQAEENIKLEVPDLLKSPIYSTGYGLLLYSGGQNNLDFKGNQELCTFTKVFKKMRSWLYDFL